MEVGVFPPHGVQDISEAELKTLAEGFEELKNVLKHQSAAVSRLCHIIYNLRESRV